MSELNDLAAEIQHLKMEAKKMSYGEIGVDMAMMPTKNGPEPVEENLKRRKANLVRQIEEIDAAIGALEKNPEILSILNTLRKVGV